MKWSGVERSGAEWDDPTPCQHEVVQGEAPDGVRGDVYSHVSVVGEVKVGMMSLAFRHRGHAVDEVQRALPPVRVHRGGGCDTSFVRVRLWCVGVCMSVTSAVVV